MALDAAGISAQKPRHAETTPAAGVKGGGGAGAVACSDSRHCHPVGLLCQPCASHTDTPFNGKWTSDERQPCDVSQQLCFEIHVSEPNPKH